MKNDISGTTVAGEQACIACNGGNAQIPQLTAEPVAKKRIFTYEELMARQVESVPTLFAPAIIQRGIAVVYGPADCGKSMLLRQMCASVACGRDFLGWEYRGTRHKAIYFSSEDGVDICTPIVKRNDRTMRLSAEAQRNLRYVFDWSAEELDGLLRQLMEDEPADLIVIDAFGDGFNGKNTNDTTEIRAFYKKFSAIAEEFDTLIVFNHHISKYAANNPPGKSSALGSEAVVSRPRLAIEMRPDPNNTDIVHLCLTKGNYLPNAEKINSVALSMDENLVFSPTGDRVPFADLAAKQSATKDRTRTKPASLEADRHRNFLRAVFGGEQRNQAYLLREIRREFEISDKTSRTFLDYYVDRKMIRPTTEKGRSIMYECTVI